MLIGWCGPSCGYGVADLRNDTGQQCQELSVGVCRLGAKPPLRCLSSLLAKTIVLVAMEKFMPNGEVPGVKEIAEGLILHKLSSDVGHGCGRRSQICDNFLIVALGDRPIGIRSYVGTT
jgi:hypothetical protein